jgi:hypothetical protein
LASNLSSFESSNKVLPFYYPKEGFCVNVGIQPSYLSPSELFENKEVSYVPFIIDSETYKSKLLQLSFQRPVIGLLYISLQLEL